MPQFASLQDAYRFARRVAIAVIGGTVVLLGIAMLVLPGPGLLVIPAGLGILALEFAWAKRWLDTLRERINAQRRKRSTPVNNDPGTPAP